ncbi:hypothetical protein PX596_002589 [Escherichia coli]|jgi:gamma-glutamyl:cysteine ligase YbdK (ATP-grasp superfamily)|nr:hypothetical protein [Escherichia coli]
MKTEILHEQMKEEARLLASETKRFQIVSAKNPICREAAELLASIRNRLNAFERMTDESGLAMCSVAESHSATLERQQIQVKKSPRLRAISPGERAKRQAVKRGALLIRGV